MKNRDLYYYCGRNKKHDYVATPMSNVIVSGGHGSGKTYFLNNLVIRLIMECNPREIKINLYEFGKSQLSIWEDAVKGWRVIPQMASYKRLSNGNELLFKEVLNEFQTILASIRIKEDAMKDVGDVGITNISAFSWERNIHIFEDIDKIFIPQNPYVKETANVIADILKYGERVGVYLIMSITSYIDILTYLIDVKDIITKVCLKQTSMESYEILGDACANTQLDRYGDCFLLYGNEEPEHLYVPFYPNTWIKKFIRYYGVENANNEKRT